LRDVDWLTPTLKGLDGLKELVVVFVLLVELFEKILLIGELLVVWGLLVWLNILLLRE
jgi:hypothetical protein